VRALPPLPAVARVPPEDVVAVLVPEDVPPVVPTAVWVAPPRAPPAAAVDGAPAVVLDDGLEAIELAPPFELAPPAVVGVDVSLRAPPLALALGSSVPLQPKTNNVTVRGAVTERSDRGMGTSQFSTMDLRRRVSQHLVAFASSREVVIAPNRQKHPRVRWGRTERPRFRENLRCRSMDSAQLRPMTSK
jgi:hypothetical protein